MTRMTRATLLAAIAAAESNLATLQPDTQSLRATRQPAKNVVACLQRHLSLLRARLAGMDDQEAK